MRSAAFLLAVAMGASAAPLPHSEQPATIFAETAAKVPAKNQTIWQHKHYDTARQSTHVKRAMVPPPAAGYQHRHYETVAANAALKKRQGDHMARVRAQWDSRLYTVSSSISAAPASSATSTDAPSTDSPSTDVPSSSPTDVPSTVSTDAPSTTSTDAPSTRPHPGHHHSHTGTRTHHPHSGAAPTDAPGTYPTQAPCWKIPFPLPTGGDADVSSWTFSTSWVLPTGVPAEFKDWPFPWPVCPPEDGDHSTDSPAPSSSTDTPTPSDTTPASEPTDSPTNSDPQPTPTDAPTESDPAPEPTDTPTDSDPAPEPTETSTDPAPAPEPTESSTDSPDPEPTQTESDPAPQPTETPEPAPSPSGPSDPDAQAYLQAHNDARAQYHADPLTWSDDLAALAKQWTSNCNFEHSGGSLSSDGYGENLAAGTGDYKTTDAVAAWMSEAPQYDSNNPQPSHFTQVVWKGSSEVGCAWSECAGGTIFDGSYGTSKFHSCMYRAPGNVIGNFPDNVQV